MKSHFIDIDVVLTTDNKVWIVNKSDPSIPVFKISQSDFNLIKSGVFMSQGNKINFAGQSYWITDSLMNALKVKCKKLNADISKLAFSMQEFLNKEVIETIDYEINMDVISHLKNSNDDIYIICSKNTKKNYEVIIKKIEDKLRENGLVVKDYYFISETFYNRNEDSISHKKIRLLLQHIVGLRTDGDKFTMQKIEKYNEIYFYDDEIGSISLALKSNDVLQILLSNTESDVKSIVKESLKSKEHILYVNQVTHNKMNKFITKKVIISWSNLIKAFESFTWKF